MTIWAIADIHASRLDSSGVPTKPMDQFGPSWVRHVDRLESSWNDLVQSGDTVVIVGDIDWALHLQDATDTLQRIHSWKGHKVLVRGNHDFWWSSKSSNSVRRFVPSSIELLHNNSVRVQGVEICGTKGSPVPGSIEWTDRDRKLLNRELGRLRVSLEHHDRADPTIVAIHYPPFYPNNTTSPYKEVIDEFGVQVCIYGHLHGDAAQGGPRGVYDGVKYVLVAGDAVGFQPVPVWPGSESA